VRKIGEQSLSPRVLVNALADMAVEVAIGALADAERPVDVEGDIALSPYGGRGKSRVSGEGRGG
jgi:hypothetical protein